MEIIFTFANTNHSVKAEQALLSGGVDVRVMPLPSAIRAGCGLCLRLAPEETGLARSLLAQAEVPVEACWKRELQDGKAHYAPYPA